MQSEPAAGSSSLTEVDQLDISKLTEVDQLDISQEADLVSRANSLPDVRADRVAELRAQIASGAYETDAKLDVALDRLLDEIG